MARDTVSLVLNGDVFLEDLNNAVGGWLRLMNALSDAASPNAQVHWRVDELSAGSFYGTLKGISNGGGTQVIEEVVRKYPEVGRGIRDGNISEYAAPIRFAARDIVSVIGRRVSSVRFETDESECEISAISVESRPTVAPLAALVASFGALRGRVQTISNRTRLRFMLYEVNTDRAVTCYIDPGGPMNEDVLRHVFGKLAIVEGTIRRDPQTGHATTIRQVRNVTTIAPLEKSAWRRVRGIAPAATSMLPEEAVRAIRDA